MPPAYAQRQCPAFQRWHGWTSVGHAEPLLGGFRDVRTVVEPVTPKYRSPEHWWESSWTQAPALAWRHIPGGRLGTDYVDLYQCHQWGDATPIEETMAALDGFVRGGKVG